MKFATFLHVAREGWIPILLLSLAGGGLAWWLDSAAWLVPVALLVAGCLAYFREPDRAIPPCPLGVLVPADGTIVHRRECHDPYLDRAAIRIGIELHRFGAYYLRAPTEGTLLEIRRSTQCPQGDRASWVQTDEKDDIVIAVVRGSMLGLRPCMNPYGQRLGQGRRCGKRRLARRLDLYLPAGARVEVVAGQRVRAGSDLLATLVHNSNPA